MFLLDVHGSLGSLLAPSRGENVSLVTFFRLVEAADYGPEIALNIGLW